MKNAVVQPSLRGETDDQFQVDRLYFAYGSNMWDPWIRRDAPAAKSQGKASALGREVVFRKVSKRDHSAKADLVDAAGVVTWGVLFALDLADLDQLNRKEGGYDPAPLAVEVDGQERLAWTYIGRENSTQVPLLPWDWYVRLMISGARLHGIPMSYIERIARLTVFIDLDLTRVAEAERALREPA